MSDLLDAIFLYINEQRVADYLYTKEYRRLQWKLQEPPEDLAPEYLAHLSDLHDLELKAMFRAALAVGLELGRL